MDKQPDSLPYRSHLTLRNRIIVETMMDNVLAAPRLTNAGILFSVTVEFQQYQCLVPATTLSDLSHSKDPKLDLLDTYRAFQTKIEGVARRLIGAGIIGKPLVIGSGYFQ
jgi:hypothetical protein